MLDWLKKLGGRKPWENIADLDEQALVLLAEDMGALEKVHPDLPNDVLRYVLDGVGEDTVERLAGTPGVAPALGLIGPLSGPVAFNRSATASSHHRDKFFECVRCAQPEFFVRLGKIYEAALRSDLASRSQLTAQFPHLANLLILA